MLLLIKEDERMKKYVLMAVASVLVAASVASAGNREGQFSVSPVIGGYSYESRQNIGYDSNPIFGGRVGYNFTKSLGVEGLFDYVYSDNGKAVNMYRYGGELLYHLFPDNTFVPYLAAGVGGVNFSGATNDKKAHAAFDAGVGAKYFLTDNVALRGDIRWIGYNRNSDFNSNLEYTLGAYFGFGGVKPAVKPVEPPPAPAPPPPAPKVEPPPPPPAPTAALTVSPATVTKGQSATLNWKSQNATGCDIQPGIGAVPPQGARQITPADSTSYNLSCSGAGGTVASAAGVTVVLPPPPAKPKAAERFCDKPSTIVVEFDTAKSDIKTKYDADLNKLGTFLKEWPKAKGEISGHTDNVGTAKYNVGLSQRRAASVKQYLVEKFSIAPERLTTEGYGETKPIATNKTKEGRQLNRRIETNFTCD
jgi:OOP family OmpA-OmpF porin